MAKFLTKEQVVADFKLNILPFIIKEFGVDNLDIIKSSWDINLDELHRNKSISDTQRDKWLLPKNLI